VLLCLVAAIPISRHFARKDAPVAAPVAPAATTADTATDKTVTDSSGDAAAGATNASSATDTSATEEAARKEQQQRDQRERARKQREEAAKNAAQDQSPAPVVKPTPSAPAGAKSVRVQISYDEAGRVTQASAIGTSPGAEAYAATAVRVARGRHFTPGKAGSTVVTIPIN
jgi:hypothetical protein